jgi:hypothetical protein
VCLYGGPGAGKSTAAAGVYYYLKRAGLNCELNREVIKDWVWEGRTPIDGDQTLFFAEMSRRERLYIKAGLDAIVTDSPLILTHFYGLKYDWLEQQCNTSMQMLAHHHRYCQHHGYKIEHYVLQRSKAYNQAGRYQTESEAVDIDSDIMQLLTTTGIQFKTAPRDSPAEYIAADLLSLCA